jgi:hypothetical protein
MRLTVNLKEDYYEAARAYSKAEDVSLSQAINRLLAIAFQKESLPIGSPQGGEDGKNGFPTSKGAKKVTAAMVDSIEADA